MTIRTLAFAALALLAGCNQDAPAGDPAKAENYAFSVPVEPVAGAELQRVDLPAAALVAARGADLADVRVFDAAGRALSAARVAVADPARLTTAPVRTWAVEGSAARMSDGKLEITLGDGTVARVGSSAPDGSGGTVAALFDTRALVDPAQRLELDVELPAQQPVTFALETSSDLKTWEPLREQVLFRPGEAAEALGGSRLDLGGAVLVGRYLKASWEVEGGSAASVRVSGARVVTSREQRSDRFAVPADGLTAEDPRTLRFDNPAHVPFAAVSLAAPVGGGVVPVKLYGRNNAEALWQQLGGAVLRGTKPATIELGAEPFGQYRLVADQRTAGFASPPALTVLVEPAALAVSFDGKPPYRLAAGLAGAPAAYLSPEELAPGLAAKAAQLPAAKVGAVPPPRLTLAPQGKDSPLGGTKLVLWLVLGLATLVLAFATAKLMRANAT